MTKRKCRNIFKEVSWCQCREKTATGVAETARNETR